MHCSRISPKVSYYYSNGTGRDTYILSDSGGIIKGKPTKDLSPLRLDKGTFRYKDSRNLYSIKKNTFMHHYSADGSGRDKYIIVDEGGYSCPFSTTNHHENIFSNNLRSYPNICKPRSSVLDPFAHSDFRKSFYEINKERTLSVKQKRDSNRLSTPKFLPDPVPWNKSKRKD